MNFSLSAAIVDRYQHLLSKLYGQSFIKSWAYALGVQIKSWASILVFFMPLVVFYGCMYFLPEDHYLLKFLIGSVCMLINFAIPVLVQRAFPSGGAVRILYENCVLGLRNVIFDTPQVCAAVALYLLLGRVGFSWTLSIIFSVLAYLGVSCGLFYAYRSKLFPTADFDKTRLLADIEDVRYKALGRSFWKFWSYCFLTSIKIIVFATLLIMYLGSLVFLPTLKDLRTESLILAVAIMAGLAFSVPYFIHRMHSGGLVRWIHRWSFVAAAFGFLGPTNFVSGTVDNFLHLVCYPHISSKEMQRVIFAIILLCAHLATLYILFRVCRRFFAKLYPTTND